MLQIEDLFRLKLHPIICYHDYDASRRNVLLDLRLKWVIIVTAIVNQVFPISGEIFYDLLFFAILYDRYFAIAYFVFVHNCYYWHDSLFIQFTCCAQFSTSSNLPVSLELA